ncbi:PhzF family phenazine biosynthesis protein [Agrobacterium rosae]|uniref:PhzF family phenazine biosynthesis protein n=1 Tax=Agrobacterium rosae TaxID=1972867 RepID=A0AAW9FCA6_9HYPH|nr:PhzF family phenazine biosynthesis protein [Agrobacterium rosae]MDX8301319.1 PhzF family phenazine biosynthesis protein [Agrobacterium rosae]POO57724.1 phenazine biosynthesis protein PhzF [Agrobacterium rosae]
MTSQHAFQQVDVFSSEPLKGNPLAVVCDADGLSDAQMAAFANWTNLSETTFLLKPTSAAADYRVRIFTPHGELPFAGHPTLGTCHVWLSRQGTADKTEVVQECEAGLVRIRVSDGKLAFAAPPLRKSGPVDADTLENVAAGLGLSKDAVVDANWTDNGPGWVSLLLRSRKDVLNIKPDYPVLGGFKVGVVAPCSVEDAVEADFELRAFADGYEDPVTGSLNAGIAQWLIGAGIAPHSYVASQGTVLGRAGRVSVDKIGDDIWIGGAVTVLIEGNVTL